MEKNFLVSSELTKVKTDKKNISKKNIKGIIFARALCCLGIVFFHYFSKNNGNFKLVRKTANSTFGFIFVTSFFCISGTVLYYNYPKIISLKTFYFKRWKSIFPPFYIYYLFHLKEILPLKKNYIKNNWPNFFFTLIGMDQYLSYKFKTIGLIGEWFLGAIIIIYILYPILLYLMNINILVINFIVFAGFIIMHKTNFFKIHRDMNIITCINSFYFGMLVIKFPKLFFKNKIVFFISLIIFLILYFYKVPFSMIINQIQGFSLYIILVYFGEYVMLSRFKGIFMLINNLSYNIFLIHHNIIRYIFGIYNPIKWYLHLILLGITFILTIIFSKLLQIIVNSIIQSHIFKNIESHFLNP